MTKSYFKLQNFSMHGSYDMVCMKATCPSKFPQSWGDKNNHLVLHESTCWYVGENFWLQCFLISAVVSALSVPIKVWPVHAKRDKHRMYVPVMALYPGTVTTLNGDDNMFNAASVKLQPLNLDLSIFMAKPMLVFFMYASGKIIPSKISSSKQVF